MLYNIYFSTYVHFFSSALYHLNHLVFIFCGVDRKCFSIGVANAKRKRGIKCAKIPWPQIEHYSHARSYFRFLHFFSNRYPEINISASVVQPWKHFVHRIFWINCILRFQLLEGCIFSIIKKYVLQEDYLYLQLRELNWETYTFEFNQSVFLILY